MRKLLILLAACVATFIVAYGARLAFVPDIVAIADAEGPQSVLGVETAFLLRSIENVAVAAGTIVLALVIARLIGRWRSSSAAMRTK